MNFENIPLFRGMTQEEIQCMLTRLHGVKRQYRKGETILREGEATQLVGIVEAGMVVIETADVWGSNSILCGAGPGSIFAEVYACLPGEPLMISARAAEDCELTLVNIGSLFADGATHDELDTLLIRNLLTVCAEKNLGLSRRILHTSSKSIRGRLLSFFSQCVKQEGSMSFTIGFNRQQLADYLSVDRSAMSAELSKMQKDGLITYERNHFTVLTSEEVAYAHTGKRS